MNKRPAFLLAQNGPKRWVRDELLEYHDGDGGLITKGHDGWWWSPDSGRSWEGPFKTLKAAKEHAG